MWISSHVGISGNEVADGLARQAVESGTVHGQMTVANEHRMDRTHWLIYHSIRPGVSVKAWFDGQAEERSFVTTISRVMSGDYSI
jgi:hypothetical protein